MAQPTGAAFSVAIKTFVTVNRRDGPFIFISQGYRNTHLCTPLDEPRPEKRESGTVPRRAVWR